MCRKGPRRSQVPVGLGYSLEMGRFSRRGLPQDLGSKRESWDTLTDRGLGVFRESSTLDRSMEEKRFGLWRQLFLPTLSRGGT